MVQYVKPCMMADCFFSAMEKHVGDSAKVVREKISAAEMDAASINYPRYKEEFDQIKAGSDGIYILSTYL